MKKTVYIVLLITITQCINAQFAAVLTSNSLILLENDSVVLVPNENLRGTMQWQKSNNAIIWSDVNTNLAGSYTVTYNVTDSADLPADEITRTVNVE